MNQPVPVLNELLNAAVSNHPELRLYQYKLQALNIERKLKFQELLPVVNFRYNQLGRGYDVWKTATSRTSKTITATGSASCSAQAFQRKGEYKKARLKINYAELELEQKKRQVENKVRSYFKRIAGAEGTGEMAGTILAQLPAIAAGGRTPVPFG